MAPRYRRNRPHRAQQVHWAMFGGNSRVKSLERTSELPRLRAGQFGKTPRPANTDVYERMYAERCAGIQDWPWVTLEVLGSIRKVALAHKDGKYVLVQCNYISHVLKMSVVYSDREEAMAAWECGVVVWFIRKDNIPI